MITRKDNWKKVLFNYALNGIGNSLTLLSYVGNPFCESGFYFVINRFIIRIDIYIGVTDEEIIIGINGRDFNGGCALAAVES